MNSTDDSAHEGDTSGEDRSDAANAALPGSAELYRQVVALSRQIPFAADRQGHILYGGSGWTALTGMPLAEALGEGWLMPYTLMIGLA